MEFRGFLFLCITAFLVVMTTADNCKEFETFNAGLSITVADSEKRRSRIVDALRSSPSDVICLQEIWSEEDLEHVIKELSPVFSHHYSAIHESKDVLRQSYNVTLTALLSNYSVASLASLASCPQPGYFPLKDTACSTIETSIVGAGVGMCAWWNGCMSKSGWAKGECIAKHCDDVLQTKTVDPQCVSCIFMNAFTSIMDAMKICSLPGKHHNRMNGPGLLLMSKHDLGAVTYNSFYPGHRMIFERGYLQAKLDNDLNVACTHLSSKVSGYLEYDVDFTNYKDQQTHEINVLDSTFSSVNTVLMGDLNTGPEVTSSNPEKNLEGEFTDNYNLLMNRGFRSPYVSHPGLCTFCHNNPLLKAKDYPNQILDHVMVRPSDMITQDATRVYNTTTPPISDHYGVRLQVCT